MSAQIAFVPHGGGPLPLMGDAGHTEMTAYLRHFADGRPRPSAIIVISAHFETSQPVITGAAQPEMLFDYYNFPDETYRYVYAAPGEPALAEDVRAALSHAGFSPAIDSQRGFDHGTFVPLMLMYPDADIPVVQLSLSASLDPDEHLRLGAALAPLADRDVLVVGSGMSFHNLQVLLAAMRNPGPAARDEGDAFQDWLVETLTAPHIEGAERRARLANWASAPGGRYSHPREEHLLPLHVCAGLAEAIGAKASITFDASVMKHRVLGVDWRRSD